MATPKPKDVLRLATEIVELENRLADLKRKWEFLLTGQPEDKPKRAPKSMSAHGLAAKIVKYLEDNPELDFSIAQVAVALDEPDLAVGKTLYRLAKTKKIANLHRGIYGALTISEREVIAKEATEVAS